MCAVRFLKSGEAWQKTFMRKRPAVLLLAVLIQSFFSNILADWGARGATAGGK
jgi:hypothetical protein